MKISRNTSVIYSPITLALSFVISSNIGVNGIVEIDLTGNNEVAFDTQRTLVCIELTN